jgi:hypothetical protein
MRGQQLQAFDLAKVRALSEGEEVEKLRDIVPSTARSTPVSVAARDTNLTPESWLSSLKLARMAALSFCTTARSSAMVLAARTLRMNCLTGEASERACRMADVHTGTHFGAAAANRGTTRGMGQWAAAVRVDGWYAAGPFLAGRWPCKGRWAGECRVAKRKSDRYLPGMFFAKWPISRSSVGGRRADPGAELLPRRRPPS